MFRNMCNTFPKDSDRCGEPKHRFFYNMTSKMCEPFMYTGCSWNRNWYYTAEECQRSCAYVEKPGFCLPNPKVVLSGCPIECTHDGTCPEDQKCCSFGCALRCTAPDKDVCKLPPKTGPCDNNVRKWFYDWNAKKCQRFSYGGCHGNPNNFKSLKECRHRCVRKGTS
ncbi:BPTI/Kunitz domain-containing protein-like [Elgaria multicarinata webbii]|uniref:BPTI/Kunitz domain-containing protein-like n=1 Tax=Elgaria multicarinata webbii TaxID=159646 RepID=UPI002FCCCAE3